MGWLDMVRGDEMSKVDWSKAPEGATAYADGVFWRYDGAYKRWRNYNGSKWILAHARKELIDCLCVEYRPTEWPDETRIDVIASNGPTGEHYEKPTNKYARQIIGLDGAKTTVDVYRVLDAFNTESAAIDHAVKKLLAPGMRHSKDREQDLREAIKSIEAELTLMAQR